MQTKGFYHGGTEATRRKSLELKGRSKGKTFGAEEMRKQRIGEDLVSG